MAAATGCSCSLFPFSVLVASSSSQGWALPLLTERTSRSFKFRDDWTLQRSKPFGSGGSCLYGSAPWGKCRCISRLKCYGSIVKVRSSNVDIGTGSYEDGSRESSQRNLKRGSNSQASPKLTKHLFGIQYPLSIAGVLLVCLVVFSAIAFTKGGPSAIVAGLAKSGFTAAFMLIFVSEIGDKTFFIAALLAMQYDKALVLYGSMGALSLMTILSVVIGQIFQSVPAQFQTRRMNSSQTEITSNSKAKRKNFLWSLKTEWITGLLQIMMEYVNANMRSAQGFKDSVYQGAAQKMKEKFGVDVTSEQCKNQIRHQRSVWSHIQELKRKSGVSWDETKKMIVMGQEEYASHIQAFPKDAAYLNITIANYLELEIVCGLGHATGEWAKSGNSQSPLGTQQIHLSDDEPSQFMDVSGDESVPTDLPNMQVTEDYIGTTKKSHPSSGTGGGVKRKCKTSDINKDIRECICLMADSVNEVAKAIKKSITSPTEIRNMYTELMFELTTIPGFSEEDVDTIYDNLSRNPTLIPSFLSKTRFED